MVMVPPSRVLEVLRARGHSHWNRGPDSATRSDFPEDASNRIFDGYADVRPTYAGPRFAADAPVFAMGSCFAREIEQALARRGGNVTSLDATVERPEFHDTAGHVRPGFFHRYTPAAMAQEFRWPFGRQPGWADDALVFDQPGGDAIDLNYSARCADNGRDAIRVRREVAGALVRKAAHARIVVVTLGLTEGWVHLPTGLAINAMDVRLVRRHRSDFALQLMEFKDAIRALEDIHETITAEHVDGGFHLFLTVSPVPFRATLTPEDVIQANMTSKATLRTAATTFAGRHANVHYFPSYEIVAYSDPVLAWRPDRIHIEPAMVAHITDRFIRTVYEEGALAG